MATSLNAGFTNNINVIQIRVNGAHMHRYTDRAIDVNGDGVKEQVTIVDTSGYAGGNGSHKVRSTVTIPVGAARTIVNEVTETDAGVHKDTDVTEFTKGS